jgi:hypothetical protein
VKGEPSPDETELLEVRMLPFTEACKMARSGEIQDAMSIVGLGRAADWLREAGRLGG